MHFRGNNLFWSPSETAPTLKGKNFAHKGNKYMKLQNLAPCQIGKIYSS